MIRHKYVLIMSSDYNELREEMLEKAENELVMVDVETESIITSAENMHELAMSATELSYDKDTCIVFTPWTNETDWRDIRVLNEKPQ